MTTPQAQVPEYQIFQALKKQIISLAIALYGTTSTEPTKVFQVISYITPHTNDGLSIEDANPSYGVALLLYTGPATSPFISWEMISYVDDQPTINAGAEQISRDLRSAMGGAVGEIIKSGDWQVRHVRIPVIKDCRSGCRESEGEQGEKQEVEEGGDDDDESDDEEAENGERLVEQIALTGWKPDLEPIAEEM